MGDKFEGVKEEVVGKLTRNHDKAEHGKEMRTGELKRKEKEKEEVRALIFTHHTGSI
jgi:hypothetical protein